MKLPTSIKDMKLFQDIISLLAEILDDRTIDKKTRELYFKKLEAIQINNFTAICINCDNKLEQPTDRNEILEAIRGNQKYVCEDCFKNKKPYTKGVNYEK